MALSPLRPIQERVVQAPGPGEDQPNRDYKLDVQDGQLYGSKVEGREAIKQFIEKAILTARFRFLIYDDEYGSELEDAVAATYNDNLLYTEIPRFIREALIYDDRIHDVINFQITQYPQYVIIRFRVLTVEGVIRQEVSVNV